MSPRATTDVWLVPYRMVEFAHFEWKKQDNGGKGAAAAM